MGEDHYKYLEKSNEILNLFESIQTGNVDVPINSVIPLDFPVNSELKNNEVCFYKIKQLSFDEDYPRREAFENVLLSMNNVNVNIRMYNFDDVQCTVIPSVAYGFVTGMNLQLC